MLAKIAVATAAGVVFVGGAVAFLVYVGYAAEKAAFESELTIRESRHYS